MLTCEYTMYAAATLVIAAQFQLNMIIAHTLLIHMLDKFVQYYVAMFPLFCSICFF